MIVTGPVPPAGRRKLRAPTAGDPARFSAGVGLVSTIFAFWWLSLIFLIFMSQIRGALHFKLSRKLLETRLGHGSKCTETFSVLDVALVCSINWE